MNNYTLQSVKIIRDPRYCSGITDTHSKVHTVGSSDLNGDFDFPLSANGGGNAVAVHGAYSVLNSNAQLLETRLVEEMPLTEKSA